MFKFNSTSTKKILIYGLVIFFLMLSCVNKKAKLVQNTNLDTKTLEDKIADKGKVISPILVGTNVWYIDPSQQVWDLTKQSGVKSIRIGGHAYDDDMPSNEQLIDWVKRIQSLGAEPILQVSQYAPPKDAEDLVKLFNVDLVTGKPIKYWNIGNEPWLQNNKPELTEVGAMVEKYFKEYPGIQKYMSDTIEFAKENGYVENVIPIYSAYDPNNTNNIGLVNLSDDGIASIYDDIEAVKFVVIEGTGKRDYYSDWTWEDVLTYYPDIEIEEIK